jgi:hypothetical protein
MSTCVAYIKNLEKEARNRCDPGYVVDQNTRLFQSSERSLECTDRGVGDSSNWLG